MIKYNQHEPCTNCTYHTQKVGWVCIWGKLELRRLYDGASLYIWGEFVNVASRPYYSGRNINFHVASFSQNNDHFDFAFFPFWCTKNFNWWLFCVENKSNNIFQTKDWMFYSFYYFPQHFSYSSFSHSLCTGWRTSGVWIDLHISKQMINETLINFN